MMEIAGLELNFIGIIAAVVVIFSIPALIINRKDSDTCNEILFAAAVATIIFFIIGINR